MGGGWQGRERSHVAQDGGQISGEGVEQVHGDALVRTVACDTACHVADKVEPDEDMREGGRGQSSCSSLMTVEK